MPLLNIIGGPNGSGKTTLSKYLLQKGRIKSNIINPDEIASNELGSYKNIIPAARLALSRRNDIIKNQLDLAFETTFSGNSELRSIREAKLNGYNSYSLLCCASISFR